MQTDRTGDGRARADAPVLFLVFNRPDTTAEVMAAIRAARPPRLYVAADGPRGDRPGEAELCDAARAIALAVDWPCAVKTLLRDRNLGCRAGVSSAIDWFFEHEEEGIILEDDCLPSPEFFPYCAALLDRFRDDERVMAVCGSCYSDVPADYAASYFFSYYADMWGWATWRRAWRLYDRDLARWPAFKADGGLQAVSGDRSWHAAYWAREFDGTLAGKFDSWGYRWVYTVIEQAGLACVPARNLISNIGFRADATHTIWDRHPAANLPRAALPFPLVHPVRFARAFQFDSQMEALRLGLTEPRPQPKETWMTRLRARLRPRRRLAALRQSLAAALRH